MLPISNRTLPSGQEEKSYSPVFLRRGYNPRMAAQTSKKPFDAMREKILARMQDLEVPMKTLSLEMGKNHAYMRQFIFTGSPQKLDEEARAYVARRLNMSEAELGGPSGATVGPVVTEYAIRPGTVTESQFCAALGPILAVFGVHRGNWPVVARAVLKALEAAQSLDPDHVQDRDYETAGSFAARELRRK